MKWILFLGAGLLILLLAAVIVWPAAETSGGQNALAARPDVVMHVQGMSCQMCARSMTNELAKLDAVKEVQVLLDEQKVLLALEEGRTVTEEVLREAVTNAGFETQEVTFADLEAS